MTTHCCEFVARFFEIFGNILAYFGLRFDWKNKNGRQETKRKRKRVRSGTSCEQGNPKRKGMCQSIQIHWNTTEFNKLLEWVGVIVTTFFHILLFRFIIFWNGLVTAIVTTVGSQKTTATAMILLINSKRIVQRLSWVRKKLFVFFVNAYRCI